MTQTEMQIFIRDLIEGVAHGLHDKVERGLIPEDWGEAELLQLAATKFNQRKWAGRRRMSPAQRLLYEQVVRERGL